jgi:hypothetical protein
VSAMGPCGAMSWGAGSREHRGAQARSKLDTERGAGDARTHTSTDAEDAWARTPGSVTIIRGCGRRGRAPLPASRDWEDDDHHDAQEQGHRCSSGGGAGARDPTTARAKAEYYGGHGVLFRVVRGMTTPLAGLGLGFV